MSKNSKEFIINWDEKSTNKRNLLKMESDGNIYCVKLKRSEKILPPNDRKDTN